PQPHTPIELASTWSVTFQPMFGEAITRQFDSLRSWTQSSEESIKYFSGTATYRADADVPADALQLDRRCLLDLGDVHDLASVRINGKALGTLWTPPFVIDVTDAIRPGKNQIEIDVTNRWV